ncbi:ParB family chromosome partitioning protein [Rhizobium leguminosarum]|uniref:ParB family chromosome partitioning protein n=2 Tax=Rhizobiaceae TaxID=82115 RepID=A0A4R2BPR0_9HYPH|nr:MULTISPECIES: plasmid partitioning protein RepB [Rhizobiaceae]MDK4716102.1 plasmid partitioning protein RepB [Rhizobium sp. CNPSo 4039]MDK4722064.1 plasmid partitioning protein RepB [Rhizobium sp. CNPSo 3968]NYJ14724.1 ParB family chromosome partitioning protein [Rhizobium leguminosarum]PDT33899.1 plasmid partitioning protein RepB [Rhizobium sp. M10]TCN28663.1 ParB family chromosome partitioning protein [Sinorhizobium americanum]
MSRENPFAKLDMASISANQTPTKPGYGMTGAAKTVVRSIEDMAENTKKLMEGEVIVDLDPRLIDVSFVADRLSDDGEEFQELLHAIKESGQTTPILVRPSSTDAKRYMVVFGHRRLKVARELGVPVKAIVKKLDDITSAIVQGQENAARSNLSFIERAFFAQNLIASGMTKETVRSSLAVDEAMLSKMLAVVEAVPASVVQALGASKKIGRDKWLSLRQLVLAPALSKVAVEHTGSADFQKLPEGERFDELHDYLKRYKAKSAAKKPKANVPVRDWTSTDRALNVVMNSKAKKVAIELTNVEARPFSEWLSSHMGRLYEEYKGSKTETNGD